MWPQANLKPKNKKSCLGCGIEFQPNASRHVRCAPCAANHTEKVRREWFRNYRKKNNVYFLEYAKRRRRESGAPDAEKREKQNRRSRRDAVMKMLGGECMECGYDRCRRSLHIHHIDPKRKLGDKDFERKGFTDFANLSLLCANCHFEVHDGIRVLKSFGLIA